MELLSSAGASKRAKAPPGNAIQVASCLVDGCNSDLSGCREYHRRHKVCEHHSKTPKVSIQGQEQRFCQQCSRFHSLIEFDEGKRSCRKRLDGHNRRRRKPQLESFHTCPRVFHSTQQGSRLLSFSNSQTADTGRSGSWAASGEVQSEDDASTMVFTSPPNDSTVNKQNLLTRSSGDMSYKNQFEYLQGNDREACKCASFEQVSAISGNRQKVLVKGVGNNSDGALSLLSSAAIQTREDHIGSSSHMMMPNPTIPMPQSVLHNLHFSGIGGHYSHGMQTNPRLSDLDTLHFQGDSSDN